MAITKKVHKYFWLDVAKLKRAQKALGAATETETIERALDFVISEHERNQRLWAAHERFLRSGIRIKDVYSTLDP